MGRHKLGGWDGIHPSMCGAGRLCLGYLDQIFLQDQIYWPTHPGILGSAASLFLGGGCSSPGGIPLLCCYLTFPRIRASTAPCLNTHYNHLSLHPKFSPTTQAACICSTAAFKIQAFSWSLVSQKFSVNSLIPSTTAAAFPKAGFFFHGASQNTWRLCAMPLLSVPSRQIPSDS